MATPTISVNQRATLEKLVAANGKLPAEEVDTRSMIALKRRGMVTTKELKKGTQVQVTRDGRKALN